MLCCGMGMGQMCVGAGADGGRHVQTYACVGVSVNTDMCRERLGPRYGLGLWALMAPHDISL